MHDPNPAFRPAQIRELLPVLSHPSFRASLLKALILRSFVMPGDIAESGSARALVDILGDSQSILLARLVFRSAILRMPLLNRFSGLRLSSCALQTDEETKELTDTLRTD